MVEEVFLGNTESVCPKCLKKIHAQKVAYGAEVYLLKECPEHGEFKVQIWQGEPSYTKWPIPKTPNRPEVCETKVILGCPFDCGLCSEHRQETCCVLLEITSDCNLHCPVCFATAQTGKAKNPDLGEIEAWFKMLQKKQIPYNIQLSGGEPTIREDLPAIITMGRNYGFNYIQLNTNGIRLGGNPAYARELKAAGLSTVFLQFDGTNDEINQKLRGRSLSEVKSAAINNCAGAGIGLVLVPTLVPDINMDNLGAIINFAIKGMPYIRGVHFQPLSYFGRYPFIPPTKRITIPEILRAIENQTQGQFKANNFLPPSAENAYCSFHGNFVLKEDGSFQSWSTPQTGKLCCQPIIGKEGLKKARAFVARQWVAPQETSSANSCACFTDNTHNSCHGINVDSLDRFLNRVQEYTLSISGMAFQDAWNLDLDRLRECKVHVLSPDKRLIPFCAYNLTAQNGTGLYRV